MTNADICTGVSIERIVTSAADDAIVATLARDVIYLGAPKNQIVFCCSIASSSGSRADHNIS